MHAAYVALLPALLGHPIPDQVYDRGIQVVVRPEAVDVQYQLALSEPTARSELQRAGVDVPESSSRVFSSYRDLLVPRIAEQVQLSIDGRRQALQPETSEIVPAHNTRIELTYRTKVTPRPTPRQLRLHDSSFPRKPGLLRSALKGRGGVTILESSAKADLIRVPRLRLKTLSSRQKAAARRITARYRVPGNRFESTTTTPGSSAEKELVSPKSPEEQPATKAGSGLNNRELWLCLTMAVTVIAVTTLRRCCRS